MTNNYKSFNNDSGSFLHDDTYTDLYTPWAGHKLFARDLISLLKPNLIVELGTYKGTSLFAFAEGILKNDLQTKLYGIDTWIEDSHSGKYDGDQVLNHVNNIIKLYYLKVNIELIRSTFNNSVDKFKDKSIDLLHIDGWHTYEAVSEDYNTWKIKLNETGVVLFHDICVKGGDFGVYKLWEEIQSSMPYWLQFDHSHGLGILCNDESTFLKIKSLITERKEYYLLKNYENVKNQLYFVQNDLKELRLIKNSVFWKLKEVIKFFIGRK